MNWITMIAGVALAVAPFLFGYSDNPAALWTGLILGIGMVVLGFLKAYIWAALAGLLAFVAPFVLGFNGIPAALWTSLVVGAVVALGDGYQGLIAGRGETGGTARA